MTTENLLIKLEQICKCGVCLERFHEPKQLVCQHIFCQQCLMKACVGNKMGLMTLFCPTCRERQPLVYRPFDVIKLKPSFLVNQILEVLVEFAVGNGKVLPHSPSSSPKKLLNTKITSVYKSINTDTLEHMTQIRTDEFGVRDSKVQELEEQVQRSKEINSQLLIDNYIMKAKLEKKVNDSDLSVLKQLSDHCPKENSTFDNDSTTISIHSKEMKNTQLPSEKIRVQAKNHIEEKLNRYLRKKALSSIHGNNGSFIDQEANIVLQTKKTFRDQGTEILRSDSETKNKEKNCEKTSKESPMMRDSQEESDFCWRCLRRGHSGVGCRESKTILGRYICYRCDKVGHKSEHCQSTILLDRQCKITGE